MPLDLPGATSGPRRSPPVGVLLLILLAVIGLLAAGFSLRNLVTGPSIPIAASSARPIAWPASVEPSPRTPGGFRPGPGNAVDSGGDVPVVSNPPTPQVLTTQLGTPSGSSSGVTASDAAYCSAIRSGLDTLTGSGLGTLKALATASGDEAPTVRAFVDHAVRDAVSIRDHAPDGVRSAAGTIVTAWSGLSAELARDGYDRVHLIGLAIKYLASPGVAAAWGSLSDYSAQHCGINLRK
jgi:hypothetical protein